MKISYIIALIVIAVGVGVIISTTGNTSEYVDFGKAIAMEQDGDDSEVHVVGKLPKSAAGEIQGMMYNPLLDANYFEFLLIDNNQKPMKVVYLQPKPQDFEKSEQVVVIGKMNKGVFLAEKILMKCPSKYEDKEIKGV
ncbi:MAG: cytochrome c maturation protein CcmE [Cytophagaceae bacterium]